MTLITTLLRELFLSFRENRFFDEIKIFNERVIPKRIVYWMMNISVLSFEANEVSRNLWLRFSLAM